MHGISQPTICIIGRKFVIFLRSLRGIYPALDKNKGVCETERFPTREQKLSDGAWCMERFHDRPFKILWRMKHTV
jgi:hypothetical protein